jgi:hypothetical protein
VGWEDQKQLDFVVLPFMEDVFSVILFICSSLFSQSSISPITLSESDTSTSLKFYRGAAALVSMNIIPCSLAKAIASSLSTSRSSSRSHLLPELCSPYRSVPSGYPSPPVVPPPPSKN